MKHHDVISWIVIILFLRVGPPFFFLLSYALSFLLAGDQGRGKGERERERDDGKNDDGGNLSLVTNAPDFGRGIRQSTRK